MSGLNSNTKLLLHCNGTDGSTSFPDASNSNHTATAQGTAQVDTAESKFGGASLFLDGNSDYLSIPDSADWDILASTSEDWTIDFWFKAGETNQIEDFMGQFSSSGTDGWRIINRTGIRFDAWVSNSQIINLQSTQDIDDTNWHHLAIIKKQSEYGMYFDGNQVAYLSDTSTATYAEALNIGRVNSGSTFFNGHMDEVRIQKSNYFASNPVSGLTDTITVPTAEYSQDAAASRNQIIIIT